MNSAQRMSLVFFHPPDIHTLISKPLWEEIVRKNELDVSMETSEETRIQSMTICIGKGEKIYIPFFSVSLYLHLYMSNTSY